MTLENEIINKQAVETANQESPVLVPSKPKATEENKDPFELEPYQSTETKSDQSNPGETNLTASENAATDQTNEHSATDASTSTEEDVNYLPLIFRDGLDMPIIGLDLRVSLPSGNICEATTSLHGSITIPVPPQTEGMIKVEVKDVTGKHQNVCEIDAAKCSNAVIIRSPKVKAEIPLRPHQQVVPPKLAVPAPVQSPNQTTTPASKPDVKPAKPDIESPWWSANGAMHEAWLWISKTLHLGDDAPKPAPVVTQNHTVAKHATVAAKPVVVLKAKAKTVTAQALNTAGQPVAVVVGGECPNKDNLKLGLNNVYRTALIGAAKRLGLTPQALCVLISCEAGYKTEVLPLFGPDGKTQLKDKKGKLRTRTVTVLQWDSSAGKNPKKAKGLTQFLRGTWLNHVMTPGFYIHDQSVVQGWVRQEDDKKKGKFWGFVLGDGKITRTPTKHFDDKNVLACLAMRDDPTWSIYAAGDYGAANLKCLTRLGFKFDSLSDMDKAKIMYLMHHEGEGGGPKFIRNTMTKPKGSVAEMTAKLIKAHGEKKAKEMIDAENGDIEKIFRKPLAAKLRGVFIQQLGGQASVDAKIAKAGGDVELAYRNWLANYVDGKFNQAGKFFCSNPVLAKDMSALLVLIGGVEIHELP